MHALLVQQGLLEVLESEFMLDVAIEKKDKKMLLEKAHNTIVLSLWQDVEASLKGKDHNRIMV